MIAAVGAVDKVSASIDPEAIATFTAVKQLIAEARQETQKDLDNLAASILSGNISAPLEAASGEAITTQDGEEIRAHGKLGGGADNRSYTDMAASAVAATLTRMVEGSYIAVR